MGTFIVNLNDTIVLSDTVCVKVAKAAEVCKLLVEKEAETNCNDVKIVAYICGAIVLVALFGLIAVVYWKEREIGNAEKERTAKATKEKEECNRKTNAGLLDKKLEILKELCYEEKTVSQEDKTPDANSKNEKTDVQKNKKVLKSIDSQEIRAYIKALGGNIDEYLKKTN